MRVFLGAYPAGRFQETARNGLRSLLQKVEADAFNEAARVNTILSYGSFLKDFPDGASADIARQRIRDRLQAEFKPDVILFIGDPRLKPGLAIARGSIAYVHTKGMEGSILLSNGNLVVRDFVAVPPDPAQQSVAIVVNNATDLPSGLERGKAYVWHGGDEFTFLRDFNPLPDESTAHSKAQQQLAIELDLRVKTEPGVIPVPFFRGTKPSMIEFVR
jgi:hypothetical protein